MSNEEGFASLNSLLQRFEVASGAIINRQKSCGLWLCNWKQRIDNPLNFIWTSTFVCTLGLDYFPSYSTTVHVNWQSVIDRVRGLLQRYSLRQLSLEGRATACNLPVYFGMLLEYSLYPGSWKVK